MKVHSQLILLVSMLSLSPMVQASAIVFSNLQENAHLCGCALNQGRQVGTFPNDPLEHFTPGDAFTTALTTDFTLDRVELAVGLISGNVNSLIVSLYSDQNGSPGSLLESFWLDNQMGPFGQDHALLVADSVLHPILTAGSSYWLLATTADPTTAAGWYFNHTLDTGPVGTRVNNDPFCCIRNDLRDAFAVLGTPTQATPEPSTAWTVAAGVSFLLMKAVFPRIRRRVRL